MIRIVKPVQAPKILTTRGAAQIQQDCAAYDASPTDHRSGQKTFNFDNKIYGAESVREALRRAQYDKCCYCEKKFRATSYGAVEHYRNSVRYNSCSGDVRRWRETIHSSAMRIGAVPSFKPEGHRHGTLPAALPRRGDPPRVQIFSPVGP